MAAEQKIPLRRTIATVVATTAVTLAIGVTAAALGGYLVAVGDGDTTMPKQVAEMSVVEAPRATPPNGPSVVLVPIAPDPRPERTVPVLAANEPKHHDKHHDHHHHQDDHDDDDDD